MKDFISAQDGGKSTMSAEELGFSPVLILHDDCKLQQISH